MPALSGITAVRPTASTIFRRVVYGATIAAGQSVYIDTADQKAKLADCNAAVALAVIAGIAMTPGISDGSGLIATEGSVILVGTTMAIGESYYVGQTPGSIVPDADLIAADFVSRIGIGKTATELVIGLNASGIAHA